MDGEPTTAVIIGDRVYVGVDTSTSFTEPSGQLRVLDLKTRAVLASCDLGGQPDAVARADDGSFLAVAIENQRDEDLNDGALPQMPAGHVVTLAVTDGTLECDGQTRIDLTGLADIAPDDPEPEYVDINAAGEIVITLQENNHVVVIGADGTIAAHFSAGTVSLDDIDTRDDGALTFDGALTDVPREPDAVKWIDADHFATANEGDYQAGRADGASFTATARSSTTRAAISNTRSSGRATIPTSGRTRRVSNRNRSRSRPLTASRMSSLSRNADR